jgi:hypothetical protein|tara:strand:+ start:387 stop:671 length:285 start_codon:yes stop_codon:yes gene_type:complete
MSAFSVYSSIGELALCVTVLASLVSYVVPGNRLAFTVRLTDGLAFVDSLNVTSGITLFAKKNSSPFPILIWLDSIKDVTPCAGFVDPSSKPNSW